MTAMPSTTSPWIRDEADGYASDGGDVGGDVQVTRSFSVRFFHRTLPNAFVTYTYYGASNDVNEAGPPYHVECQTEFMVCRDPKDPGGTEVWSDLFYGPPSDRLGVDAVVEFTSVEEAKEAAQRVATAHRVCDETWSGQPPWATEEEASADTLDEHEEAAEHDHQQELQERLRVIEVLLATWEADALTVTLPDGSDDYDRQVVAGEVDDLARLKDLIVDNLLDQVLEALSPTDEMSLLARARLSRGRP